MRRKKGRKEGGREGGRGDLTLTNGTNLLWLVQEEINDEITPLGVIEKHEQTPVNQPCPFLQKLQCSSIDLKQTQVTYLTCKVQLLCVDSLIVFLW